MKPNKFGDIKWIPTSINHNLNSYNKDCIIGVPVYKNILTDLEKASLYQLCNIIQNSFEICLICPSSIDLSEYNKIAYLNNIELSTLYCNEDYFKGTNCYSYLCETTNFYKCFFDYKYLMIYQLDAWIFKNNLLEFIDLDVDYIGGPWHAGSFRFNEDTIGNGGVSLRKISKFIEVCLKFIPSDFEKEYVGKEDLFFCKTHRNKTNFKYPNIYQAVKFAITAFGKYFVTRYNDGKLPMCIHAWEKEIYLKKFIDIESIIYKIENNIKEDKTNIQMATEIKNIKQSNNNIIQKSQTSPFLVTNVIEDEDYASMIMDYLSMHVNGKSKKIIKAPSYQDYYYNEEDAISNAKNVQHINLLIVHFNTPYLTECLIKSINKFVKNNCTIYIFDNSDKEPFTYKQDNIVLFDNTKGQIIDFDKWLDLFPEKTKSSAWKNNYGSAKHSKSIQKCMELINDNFILLDSDILLKKNIVELFDDKFCIIGDTELWKPRNTWDKTFESTKPRLIPYICFINVNKCKRKHINYHNDNFIYGLTKSGDNYDTGAYIYEECNNTKESFKRINCNDYIVHFKGGSWLDSARKIDNYQLISLEEWIEKNKQYWKNDKVIYTCITRNYEKVIDPTYILNDFDYICFTDNLNRTSNIWKFRPIPEELKNLTKVKQQRLIKICPHRYLSEYSESIWVDGSIDILNNMDKFIETYCNDDTKSVFVRKHPVRSDIYKEGIACIALKKDTKENVEKQILHYRDEGLPEKSGLVETNIMYRLHNDEYCKGLMENWAIEILNGSHRDLLSFNYVLWKYGKSGFLYLDSDLADSKYFKWYPNHNRQ